MNLEERLTSLRTGFSSSFWIANTLELFERFAFYGAKAILTKFLAEKAGLNEEAGTLAGLFSGVVYSLPILAGVLVDRYGFRRTLISCFAIFSIGYFLIGAAGMEWSQEITAAVGKKTYVISVLLLTAIGGSLIKPCIVGTVAATSKTETRSLGYSIYYSLVNLGGAIGPIFALQVREEWGIEYVLVMSSMTSLLLCIGTILFFKEPVTSGPPIEQRTFGKVFSDMLLVFMNIRFMTILLIFSGFWIMFWQVFYLLPFYSTDVLHFERYELLETIDAWGIIVFSLVMTEVAKKMKPFSAMIMGFILASVSWVILGMFGTVTAVIVGVGLYSIGEATQAPRFYEYVSTLAPKDQVGTFMGFAFLPVAIGSFVGGGLADNLRLAYIHDDPAMMWFINAGIGLTSTLLLILYNQFVNRKAA